jgi:hypothetical protein
MMEMTQQISPVVKTGNNNMGSNRRPVGSVRRRARARELASAQLSLFHDFDTLESNSTLKPVAMVEVEAVRTPSIRTAPVYKESVDPEISGQVHYLDRTASQCCYPTWADGERDIARHFMCGGEKTITVPYCSHHMLIAYGRKAA